MTTVSPSHISKVAGIYYGAEAPLLKSDAE